MWLAICYAATIAIVALKWFKERIRFTAIIYYIVEKGYTPPSRDELMEHVARTLLSAAQYPEFPPGNVPVSVAQKVFGKSGTWVRKGMEDGWLDIGIATGNGSRGNYYISPKKLWELTGYLWDGKS